MSQLNPIAISVVIPTYNREKTVGYALRSVLNQTYPPTEILVVDDCSTDNTVEVLKAIGDARIRVIVQDKNQGAQAARNRGIMEAKGPWIALHDSDDEWLPNRLEEGVKALATVDYHPFTLVHCNCYKYYENTREKVLWELPEMNGSSAEVLPKVLREPGPMFQGMLTSKEALLKIGLLDTAVPSYQEWDTTIRLAKVCRLIHIKEPLFLYYFHEGDAISKGKNSDMNGYHFIRLKHKQDTIAQLGQAFYDENIRWNIERAFYRGGKEFTKKLIKMSYPPSSVSYHYLMQLLRLGIEPLHVRMAIDPIKAPFRPIKRLLGG